MADCRCNCGYTCGRKCGLEITECIKTHYVRDCDHDWDGWVEFTDIDRNGKEYVSGGSRVCKRCGMDAMTHDMMRGP